jgi:hypothetical protein
MPRLGRKQISYAERLSMVRKKPKKISEYDCQFANEHRVLVDSFTKDDYLTYEKLMHSWGSPGRKRQFMLDMCIKNNIAGPVLELTTIRNSDLKSHQKIFSMLRSRWTTIYEHRAEQINTDADKFWLLMARTIQRRCKELDRELYCDWEGETGLPFLADFLKALYQKQAGLCAISQEKMELAIGVNNGKIPNKCSPDRKNSKFGYTPENLWLVNWWVNQMKLDIPIVTFWKRIDTLYNAKKQRVNNALSKISE